MRIWQIDAMHGQYAVDSTVLKDGKLAVVSLRRPAIAGGTIQSRVPLSRAYDRILWIIRAVVKRLTDTDMAG